MKLKKLNQTGVAVLEIILILFVIGAVAGIGYYVYQAKIRTNKTLDSTAQGAGDAQKSEKKKETEKPVLDPTADWTTYTGHGVTLKYPASWKVTEQPEGQKEWVNFSSADFKPATALGASVEAGYLLELRVSKPVGNVTTYEQDLEANKKAKADGGCGGDYSTVTVSGSKAILSDMKCHGSDVRVTLYKNGMEYFVRLNSLDEDKPEVRELFNNILKTVQVN